MRRIGRQAFGNDGADAWFDSIERRMIRQKDATSVLMHLVNHAFERTLSIGKRASTVQHFAQQDTQRKDVAALVGLGVVSSDGQQVFRSHIRKGPANGIVTRGRAVGRFGQIEVQQHGPPIIRDQNIGRLEISMHNILFVCMS